jgi:hypothetical protein
MRIGWRVALSAMVLIAAMGASAALAPAAKNLKFKRPRVTTVGFDPLSLAAAKLNGDRHRDIVTANFAASEDPASEISISVLRGSRKGRLKPVSTFDVPSQPDGIAVGKLAGDNDPDIVVGGFSGAGEVTVFRGGPGLGFGPPESYPIGGTPREIEIADFNRDGAADIAARRQLANDIAVMRGLPAGGFAAPLLLPAGGAGFLTDIVSARLNRDRRPDLAALRSDGKVVAYLAKPNGAFSQPIVSGVGGAPLALDSANFDRNRKQDLVVTIAVVPNGPSSSGFTSTKDKVKILAGKGNGKFKRLSSKAVGGGGGILRDVKAADFDRDGRTDVAASFERVNQVAILRGRRKRGRLAAPTFVGTKNQPLALLADRLNRDRVPDLAVSTEPETGPGKVEVLIQKHKRKRRR